MIREFGSNFETDMNLEIDLAHRVNDTKSKVFLRTGRECLYLIGSMHNENKTIVLPALCCSSMIQPFIQLGKNIRYYQLNEDLSINYDSLFESLCDNAFLLIMSYYGRPTFTGTRIKAVLSRFSNVITIQDCTQHSLNASLFEDFVDYQISSIRKWICVPDGAVLSSEKHLLPETATVSDDAFVSLTLEAMQLKTDYLFTGENALKDAYRKSFTVCAQMLKSKITPYSMSEKARRILAAIDIPNVRQKRRENFNTLFSKIYNMYPETARFCTEQDCPLCFPIIVEKREEIQNELISRRIYTQVLWPLSSDSSEKCSNSRYFSEHMLAVPCDQRYSVEDMIFVANNILNVISSVDN